MQQPPTIVVVNQPAPSPPGYWYHDVDGVAAGSIAAVCLIILLAVGCLLLRRFRPQTWKAVKAAGLRVLQWVALPASWVFSKAAEALHHFHQTSHNTTESGQQKSAMQV